MGLKIGQSHTISPSHYDKDLINGPFDCFDLPWLPFFYMIMIEELFAFEKNINNYRSQYF